MTGLPRKQSIASARTEWIASAFAVDYGGHVVANVLAMTADLVPLPVFIVQFVKRTSSEFEIISRLVSASG